MTRSSIGVILGGVFSLAVAIVSGFIAYYTARTSSQNNLEVSRANLEGELTKITEQVEAQQAAQQKGAIASLHQRYLTPLRYYAHTLGARLEALEGKFRSDRNQEVRDWFKALKDHVTRDRLMRDYYEWCYYKGIFSMSTLYYTSAYFYWAREIRFHRPLSDSRPAYSEQLDARLASVSEAFSPRGSEDGIWDTSQEVIGEKFVMNGSMMTYAELCLELDAEEPFRRAPFFRPIDFFWNHLNVNEPLDALNIKASLDELVAFLDSHDPQTYGLAK